LEFLVVRALLEMLAIEHWAVVVTLQMLTRTAADAAAGKYVS
jgi:hypothetical protein